MTTHAATANGAATAATTSARQAAQDKLAQDKFDEDKREYEATVEWYTDEYERLVMVTTRRMKRDYLRRSFTFPRT